MRVLGSSAGARLPRSMASLQLMGTTTASAPRYSAVIMPSRSPRKELDGAGRLIDPEKKRAVAVAIGRYHRIDALVRVGQTLHGGKLLVVDVLRVDGHEGIAAAGADHSRAQPLQNLGDDVAAGGGVRVEQQPQAFEWKACEERDVPVDVRPCRAGVHRRQLHMPAPEHAVLVERGVCEVLAVDALSHLADHRGDWRLMLFQQLAAARVRLVAVAVEGDVAAGHHHAAASGGNGVVGQGGRRNAAGVHGQHTGIANRVLDGLRYFASSAVLRSEARGTGPQVPGKTEFISPNDAALGTRKGLQELQLARGIDADLQLGERCDFSTASAGAEPELARLVAKMSKE